MLKILKISKKKIKFYKKEEGFTIIEMLVSMAIFAMITLVVGEVFIYSINLSHESDNYASLQDILQAGVAQIDASGIKADCVISFPTVTDYFNTIYGGSFPPTSDPCIAGTQKCVTFSNSQGIGFMLQTNPSDATTLTYWDYSSDGNPYPNMLINTNANSRPLPQLYLFASQGGIPGSAFFEIDPTNTSFDLHCPTSTNSENPYVTFKITGKLINFYGGTANTVAGPITVYSSIDLNNGAY